jgi:hypothetical protein
MERVALFGGREYLAYLSLLVFSRGMDFLSTWIATPNLLLEANPIARKLRWKGNIVVNVALCLAFACLPLTSIIISTTSVLVAARNFQNAWLMRSQGEVRYRAWFAHQVVESPRGLFLACLLGQTLLIAAVGAALVVATGCNEEAPLGIGLGIVGYALAVLLYTLLALWRNRRLAL